MKKALALSLQMLLSLSRTGSRFVSDDEIMTNNLARMSSM